MSQKISGVESGRSILTKQDTSSLTGGGIYSIINSVIHSNAMTSDPNDKYSEYKVDFHAKEGPSEEEGKEAWETRHRDKLLDNFCDDHPSAPQCKVFDDWSNKTS